MFLILSKVVFFFFLGLVNNTNPSVFITWVPDYTVCCLFFPSPGLGLTQGYQSTHACSRNPPSAQSWPSAKPAGAQQELRTRFFP